MFSRRKKNWMDRGSFNKNHKHFIVNIVCYNHLYGSPYMVVPVGYTGTSRLQKRLGPIVPFAN